MNHDIVGDFEIHLTVDGSVDHLQEWCAERNVKFSHILLDRGMIPSQPMVTARGTGSGAEQRNQAARWSGELESAGFRVTRVKIEVTPWSAGVPQADDEAVEGHYFEHHVKLLLDSDADVVAVGRLAGQHTAHVSRNARRVRDDRRSERFVTQRCWDVGAQTAELRLSSLLAELRPSYEILEVEQEYVVLDDRPALDAGWITDGRA